MAALHFSLASGCWSLCGVLFLLQVLWQASSSLPAGLLWLSWPTLCICRVPLVFIDVNSVPGGLVYGQGIKVGSFNIAVFSASSCQDETSEMSVLTVSPLLTLACCV